MRSAVALALTALIVMPGCGGSSVGGTVDVAPTGAPTDKSPTSPERLGSRGRSYYRSLVTSHAEMGSVLNEAVDRRAHARGLVESAGKLAGPFTGIFSSSPDQLAEAVQMHADAAGYMAPVLKAAKSGFANERAYQALHDAVTSAGHTVLGMTSVIGNCLQICEIRRIRGEEPCDPAVIDAVRSLLDLKADVMAALP